MPQASAGRGDALNGLGPGRYPSAHGAQGQPAPRRRQLFHDHASLADSPQGIGVALGLIAPLEPGSRHLIGGAALGPVHGPHPVTAVGGFAAAAFAATAFAAAAFAGCATALGVTHAAILMRFCLPFAFSRLFSHFPCQASEGRASAARRGLAGPGSQGPWARAVAIMAALTGMRSKASALSRNASKLA